MAVRKNSTVAGDGGVQDQEYGHLVGQHVLMMVRGVHVPHPENVGCKPYWGGQTSRGRGLRCFAQHQGHLARRPARVRLDAVQADGFRVRLLKSGMSVDDYRYYREMRGVFSRARYVPVTVGRKLVACPAAEIAVRLDWLREFHPGREEFASTDPRRLPLVDLCYVRYAWGDGQVDVLRRLLPHFAADVEGRPAHKSIGSSREAMRRQVLFFERSVLETLFLALEVNELYKYLVTPPWYEATVTEEEWRAAGRTWVGDRMEIAVRVADGALPWHPLCPDGERIGEG